MTLSVGPKICIFTIVLENRFLEGGVSIELFISLEQ